MAATSSIVGHTAQREQLRADIEQNQCAHAYLFEGKKHIGKSCVLRWFAEELLTHNKEEDEKEKIRTLLEKNMHPDTLILDRLWVEGECTDWNIIAKSSTVPQEHRAKAKLKTNTIGIDDVRTLQERLYETPQGDRTLCLIHAIDRLQPTAANALLKILEEPPPHVLFCFTTESISQIPATIISRMRVLHFSPVPQSELLPLVEDLPQEDQELLLSVAQGAPGIIIRCREDAGRLRMERQARIDARYFLQNASPLDRVKRLQEALDGGDVFFRQLFLCLQEALRGDGVEAEKARLTLHRLFPILHSLQSNTNRPLLAAHAALSCTP